MRKILYKYSPQFSKIRNVTTLLPAWAPDWAHLIGRALRSYADDMRVKRFLKIKGKIQCSPTKYSWIGGDVWIREENEIEELKKLLNGSILNVEAMNVWLDEIQAYEIAVGDGQDLLRVIELDLLSNSAITASASDNRRID